MLEKHFLFDSGGAAMSECSSPTNPEAPIGKPKRKRRRSSARRKTAAVDESPAIPAENPPRPAESLAGPAGITFATVSGLFSSLFSSLPAYAHRLQIELRVATATLVRAIFAAASAMFAAASAMSGFVHSFAAWLRPLFRQLGRINLRLAAAAILSCAILAIAAIRAPVSPGTSVKPNEETMTAGATSVVHPQAQPPEQAKQRQQPEQTGPTEHAAADIRVIDGPSRGNASCRQQTWPYLAERCLTSEQDETQSIASDPGPAAETQDRNVPIGGVAAVVEPAHPAVSATDGADVDGTGGVASRESSEPADNRAAETHPDPAAARESNEQADNHAAETYSAGEFSEQPDKSVIKARSQRVVASDDTSTPTRREKSVRARVHHTAERRQRDGHRSYARMRREPDPRMASGPQGSIFGVNLAFGDSFNMMAPGTSPSFEKANPAHVQRAMRQYNVRRSAEEARPWGW